MEQRERQREDEKQVEVPQPVKTEPPKVYEKPEVPAVKKEISREVSQTQYKPPSKTETTPKRKPPIEPKKTPQPSPEKSPIEKPTIIISEPFSPQPVKEPVEEVKPTEKPTRAKSATTRTKSQREEYLTDLNIRRPTGLRPVGEADEQVAEIKRKDEEEKERNPESSSKVWSQESPMGSINLSLMDSDIISPGTGSLASGSMSSPPEPGYQEDIAAPTGTPFLSALAERDLLNSIKKIIVSKQTEDVSEFRQVKETGKIAWTKTHFIFMLDCSGSMAGARWDSVVVGLFTCLKRIRRMVDVCVSAFTFDTKPNPFCRERTPQQAIVNAERMPFTGKGTNYMRALEYAISLVNKTRKENHLLCLLFLSDGLGGYPVDQVEKLKAMRKKGKKILFYTIACVTDEEKDMMRMATELQGEHYKVTNEEASRLVFSTILNV